MIHTGTTAVIAHAIEWLRNQGQHPINVCCLYATTPFVLAADLRRGLDVLEQAGCDYSFSVTSLRLPDSASNPGDASGTC